MAGERLDLEKAFSGIVGLIFGALVVLGGIFRALRSLPGGIGRFLPCDIIIAGVWRSVGMVSRLGLVGLLGIS